PEHDQDAGEKIHAIGHPGHEGQAHAAKVEAEEAPHPPAARKRRMARRCKANTPRLHMPMTRAWQAAAMAGVKVWPARSMRPRPMRRGMYRAQAYGSRKIADCQARGKKASGI